MCRRRVGPEIVRIWDVPYQPPGPPFHTLPFRSLVLRGPQGQLSRAWMFPRFPAQESMFCSLWTTLFFFSIHKWTECFLFLHMCLFLARRHTLTQGAVVAVSCSMCGTRLSVGMQLMVTGRQSCCKPDRNSVSDINPIPSTAI